MEDRDFIDFKFGDHWASDFNLLAVSSGDRYSPPVYGSVNPNTATIAGKIGVYKWKTQVNEKVFNIKIAFDNINGQILNQIKEWLNPFKIDKLVFKEEPYKYYWVALNTEPKLDFLPFLEETKVVNGIAFKEGVYKGEFELQFVCFDNYGYSDWQSFDENYDYVVKEIEGEESISFNDGSDNNLIITKIEGNSKQRTREEVTGTVINGSEMTINEEYISNKTQFVIDGNSEQKQYEGYNILNVPSVLNITSEEVNRLIDINIDADTKYTIKADKIETDSTKPTTILFRFIDSDNADISYVYLNLTDKHQTFSLNKNAVKVRIYSSSGHNASAETNTTFTNLMIYKGTDLTKPYEPYVGGQPSPNPEYPQDIEVIDGVNLFPINEWYIPYSSGNLKLLIGNKSIFLKKGTYYLSFEFKNIGSPSFNTFVRWYSEEVTNIDVTKQVGYKSIPTASSPAKVQFTLDNDYWVGIDDSQTKGGVEYKKIMLSKEDIPYLPHGCIGLEQSGKNLCNLELTNWVRGINIEKYGNGYKITATQETDSYSSWVMFKTGLKLEDYLSQILYASVSNKPNVNNLNSLFRIGYWRTTNTFEDFKYISMNEEGIFKINSTMPSEIPSDYNSDYGIVLFINVETENLAIGNNIIVTDFMISKEDTSYEPYHSPKVIPINLDGNSLAKAGDVKDILRVNRNGEVEIKKNTWEETINGSDLITLSNNNKALAFYLSKKKTASLSDNDYLVTNAQRNKTFSDGTVYQNPANFVFVGSPTDTLETIKAKFNGGKILYQLATPQIIKLPSISPIELWEGTNKFELVTNLDTTMELTYNYLPAVPSIEEPSEIKNCKDSINIKVCNKNLLNVDLLDFEEKTINGVTIKNNHDGTCSVNGTTTGIVDLIIKGNWNTPDIFSRIEKGNLYYSTNLKNTDGYICLYDYHSKGVITVNANAGINNQTVENITYMFIRLAKTSGITFNEDKVIFQLEYNSITELIPHEEQTTTFPLAEGQVLHEDDYLAEDGIHQIKNTIVFDGTENWTYDKGTDKNNINNYSSVLHFTDRNEDNNYSKLVCSHFQDKDVWEKVDITGVDMTKYYIYVSFPKTLASTQEEWKNWLAEQYEKGTPVKIEYYTREKIVIPYTTEQQIVYDEIKNNLYSYEGTNHIFSTDEVPPLLSISYVPKQDIYIDYVANQSNLLNDSAFYYNNDIYKKSYFDAETGDATKSGISEDRPVYLYNAGTTTANLNLTFDMIIPAEGSPLVINTESCKLTDDGIQILKQVSSISISDFSKYKPFLEIYDGTPSNWQIQIDSNLCEIYLKHKTDKTKIISLNKFNDNQSFLSLANCNFVDYSKPFPTLITAISGTALENTVFNKLSVGTSAQNYRLKNVNVEWKHTYL